MTLSMHSRRGFRDPPKRPVKLSEAKLARDPNRQTLPPIKRLRCKLGKPDDAGTLNALPLASNAIISYNNTMSKVSVYCELSSGNEVMRQSCRSGNCCWIRPKYRNSSESERSQGFHSTRLDSSRLFKPSVHPERGRQRRQCQRRAPLTAEDRHRCRRTVEVESFEAPRSRSHDENDNNNLCIDSR